MTIRPFILALFTFAAVGAANAQCLVLNECPTTALQVCDVSTNDPFLWSNLVFWIDTYGSHDLPDVPFESSTSVVNNCGNPVTVGFRLFLDVDNNGSLESVIQSSDLPPAGSIWINNASQPNYQGTTTAIFDDRLVPANEKYQFAIEQTTVGNVTTAWLRWTTPANPGVYIPVQLPEGTFKIDWVFADPIDGTDVTCTQVWVVKDCKPPTVICQNLPSVNIMPTQLITLWATDFLQYTEDNTTPIPQMKIGIVKSAESTGFFPTNPDGSPRQNVVFTCAELGTQPVQIWAIDASGNADFCETYVLVQDNLGNCSGNPLVVNFCTKMWCNGAVIGDVEFGLQGTAPAMPPINISLPMLNGCSYYNSNAFPLGSSVTVEPTKDDDPLNGVTIIDLVDISKHILGLDPLPSPYAMIAADANKSGSITTFDLVELKKLLLGIYTELPNNMSWRFIDSSFVFPNPASPFQTAFPENLTVPQILNDTLQFSFVAIKIGDVDCSAIPGFQGEVPQERSTQRTLTIPDATLLAGETMDLPIRTNDASDWLALQMGLQFDPQSLVIEVVTPGNFKEMDAGSFALSQTGLVNVAWFQPFAQHIAAAENIATIRVRALQPVHLKDAIALNTGSGAGLVASGYDAQENGFGLQLEFQATQQPQESTGIFAPQPNPTQAYVTIPVRLAQTENVRLQLTDLNGKILYNLQKTLERGTQLLEIPADVFQGTGMYGWRVSAGETIASGTIVRY